MIIQRPLPTSENTFYCLRSNQTNVFFHCHHFRLNLFPLFRTVADPNLYHRSVKSVCAILRNFCKSVASIPLWAVYPLNFDNSSYTISPLLNRQPALNAEIRFSTPKCLKYHCLPSLHRFVSCNHEL